MKIKCRGCKKNSWVDGAWGGSVGHLSARTGFIWIPSAGGDALWLCPKCAEQLMVLTGAITELVGEFYTYLPTLQDILRRELAKDSKKVIRK